MSNLKLKHPDFNAGDYKFNTVEVHAGDRETSTVLWLLLYIRHQLSTLIQQTMQLRLAMTMRKALHTAE